MATARGNGAALWVVVGLRGVVFLREFPVGPVGLFPGDNVGCEDLLPGGTVDVDGVDVFTGNVVGDDIVDDAGEGLTLFPCPDGEVASTLPINNQVFNDKTYEMTRKWY
ncbi:hypothetical protein SNE40_008706 [Patella caerulea]|uniref:Uncharacterized protein n=1 Tax=Patella caerulea TaxID=87958 RepID=A0AAN8Q202_PATCE